MANPSSRKKIARAARAGGTRRVGERRPLGFNAVIAVIVVLGFVLVFVARDKRLADAHPKGGGELAGGDHWHDGYSVYTCVPDQAPTPAGTPAGSDAPGASGAPDASAAASADPAAASPDPTATVDPNAASPGPTDSVPEATTTTINPASTTIPAPGEVPGFFQDPLTDVGADALGIHTHGDSLIHIHPFSAAQVSSAGGTGTAAGRNARLGVFLDDTGVTMDDSQLVLPNGQSFIEGQTKCQGKDGEVQVARWNTIDDALADKLPNAVYKSDFSNIRFRQNGEYYVIAFVPDGARIPVNKPVLQDFQEKGASDVSTTTTTPASGAPSESGSPGPDSSGSPAPAEGSAAPPAS